MISKKPYKTVLLIILIFNGFKKLSIPKIIVKKNLVAIFLSNLRVFF